MIFRTLARWGPYFLVCVRWIYALYAINRQNTKKYLLFATTETNWDFFISSYWKASNDIYWNSIYCLKYIGQDVRKESLHRWFSIKESLFSAVHYDPCRWLNQLAEISFAYLVKLKRCLRHPKAKNSENILLSSGTWDPFKMKCLLMSYIYLSLSLSYSL